MNEMEMKARANLRKMKIIELIPGYDLALADLIRFNLKKHHLAYADYIQGSRTFLEVSEDYRRV